MITDATIQRWIDADERLDALPPEQQPAAQRVAEQLVLELRKRLGSRFTTAELLDLYGQGTAWCLALATQLAPGAPWAWDARIFDAAFARYVRRAEDFAGGRLIDRG